MIRYYKGGFDPWDLTLAQWNSLLDAMTDISAMESGKTDDRSNALKMARHSKRLRKIDALKRELIDGEK